MLGTLGPIHQADPREWARVMDVNVTANFRLIRTLDPMLRMAEKACVIFVSSSADVTSGRAYWGSYGVSKIALETLARTYTAETEKTQIHIYVVDPGRVRTAMRAQAKPGEDPMTLRPPEEIAPVFVDIALGKSGTQGEIIRL
jgi:NAD(P)-dependent dehydrogenase (short-subunit alcohol dehydrogenase family)